MDLDIETEMEWGGERDRDRVDEKLTETGSKRGLGTN